MSKCAECGAEFERKWPRASPERTTCGVVCRNRLIARTRQTDYSYLKGAGNVFWKGGTKKSSEGYAYIWMPDHPNASRGYIKRATLVLEQELGRYLISPEEIAHHKDHDRSNDSPENLELMSRQEHNQLHLKEARIARWKGKERNILK